MKTDSTFPDSKVERKAAASVGDRKSSYEVTEFGRRRVSRLPQPLAMLVWLLGFPFAFIYRRLRRYKSAPK
jgi:hypothetical protein